VKIRDVKTYQLEAALAEPFAYSQAWYERRGALLIEIVGEDGLSGWGEAFGPPFLTAPIVEFYRAAGASPDGWSSAEPCPGLCDRLRKRGGDPFSYLIEETQQRADAGFTAIKLKLGFGIDEDIRLCRAIRQAIGEAMTIMVDANHAYDAVAAIRLGRHIEELDVSWFEEPVPPEDLEGYRQVKSALRIPIAGGEAEFTRWGFRPILVDRVLDILQPDVCAAGGLSECKKIADMATAFGLRVNPHVWGTGVALAASLQLLAILPDNPPSLNPIAPLLEFDQSEHPIRMAVLTEPISQQAGWVEVPTGPGLGIEIDRAAITKFLIG